MDHTVHGPPVQSRDAAAYRAVPAARTMICRSKQTVHGLPVQSRDAAAYRAVPAARAMMLAHMAMNGGKCNEGLAGMGSRQRQADNAWQEKTRPVVKLTGTGLAAKTAGR